MLQRVRFAVSREDPSVEAELIRQRNVRSVLLAGGGGCTALSIKRQFPGIEVVVFDTDARQIEHIRAKLDAAMRGDGYSLNVGDATPTRLNQSGLFEGLFRVLREFLLEFVLREHDLESFFRPQTLWATRTKLATAWCSSKHWAPAFDAAFAVPVLRQLFDAPASRLGTAASCVRRAIERGLQHPKGGRSPTLQHIFLGCYYNDDAPLYARTSGPLPVKLVHGDLEDVPDLQRFDLISLSNVFDWADEGSISRRLATLNTGLRQGATVLLRHLDGAGTHGLSGDGFVLDPDLAHQLLEGETSFFADRLEVATKV